MLAKTIQKVIIVAVLFFSLNIFAEPIDKSATLANKTTVAVLNFTAPVSEPELVEWGERYAEFLAAEFGKENWLSIVERNKIDKLLKEMELKLSGLSSVEQSIAIGKMLDAQFLIVGKLDAVEDGINIEADLVQVSTGNILAKEKLKCKWDELYSQSAKLSSFILEKLSKITQVKKPDKKPKTIALLRFKNKSKFKRLDSLEESLPQMLMDDFKLIPGILVLERQHIEKILAEVELTEFGLIENATAQRALGADFVISGSFEEKIESGKLVEELDLKIMVDINDVMANKVVSTIEVQGKAEEVERLEKEAIVKIIRALDIQLLAEELSIPKTEKGRLFEVAIYYARGLEIYGVRDETRYADVLYSAREKYKYKEALKQFQKSLYLDSRFFPAVQFFVARCYQCLGNREKAVGEYQKVIDNFAESKWIGYSLYEQYECSRNIQFLKKLVNKYPEHPRTYETYRDMSNYYYFRDDYEKSVEYYTIYLKKWLYGYDEQYLQRIKMLVRLYRKADKPEDAIRVIEETIGKNITGARIYWLYLALGDIHCEDLKSWEEAIGFYKIAVSRWPRYDTLIKLAKAYMSQSRWEEAKEIYDKIINNHLKKYPSYHSRFVNAFWGEAKAYEHLGEWGKALKCYEKLSDKPGVLDRIKICYEKLGRSEEWLIYEKENKSCESTTLRYAKGSGLAQNNVTALALDADGIWVATSRMSECYGPDIFRYAGHPKEEIILNYYDKETKSWKRYGREIGLSLYPITSIFVDKGTVWFGTLGGGALKYTRIENKWYKYTKREGLFDNEVYAIVADSESVWFGGGNSNKSNGWICKLDKESGKWYVYIPPKVFGEDRGSYGLKPCPTVSSLGNDGEYLWVGVMNWPQIFRFHKPTERWENCTPAAHHDILGDYRYDHSVTDIVVESACVWFGTCRGIKKYDKTLNRWQSLYTSYTAELGYPSNETKRVPANVELPSNRITDIEPDGDCLWIASGGGLCVYSKESEILSTILKPKASPISFPIDRDSIIKLAIDENSIWCGTKRNGLIRYLKPHALPAGDAGKEQK